MWLNMEINLMVKHLPSPMEKSKGKMHQTSNIVKSAKPLDPKQQEYEAPVGKWNSVTMLYSPIS